MYLYAEHILVVDLKASTAISGSFEDELAEEVIGGAALAERLLAEHADRDPVVLATGPLTGTLAPGGSLCVMSRLGEGGAPLHVPLTLFLGSELKYSGFDAVVILGASAAPVYLWLHDGIAVLEDASQLWGLDTWETSDTIKTAKGDEVIQVLAVGPAGERGVPAAQVVANYWSTADANGFGAVLGAKNLKAVAMRGLGILDAEEAEELFEHSLAMGEAVATAALPGNVIQGLVGGAPDSAACDEWLAPAVHRGKGCFSCPCRCFTYVKYNEPADELRSTDVAEPGCLLTDGEAVLTLFRGGFSPEEAGRLLEGAARRGVQPQACVAVAVSAGAHTAADGLAAIDGDPSSVTPVAPMAGTSDERVRAGYVLGVCPVFLATSESPATEELLEAVRLGTGMSLDAAGLQAAHADVAGDLSPRVV